jgi:aldose 1-epimerase
MNLLKPTTLALTFALAGIAGAAPRATITSATFGTLPGGRTARLFTLTNAHGMQAKITNYGGIVTSLRVPDRRGRLGDVVLGYDNLASYVKATPYFGAIAGRYGNRIAKGRFTLDGKTYQLATNNGPNHLHGGVVGFDKRLWRATTRRTQDGVALDLRYFSPSGEEGYPGNLQTRVTYTLTNANTLRINYRATTDKATPFNPTHHSYFNLTDGGRTPILDHVLQLRAHRFTVIDNTSIPTGELRSVVGTPFDFLRPTPIGARLKPKGQTESDEQLRNGSGYDHNFVLDGPRGQVRRIARVVAPKTGRVMTVFTDRPGVQLYTGNFLDATNIGKGGVPYGFRSGFCLEAQGFPDSPNHPSFPSTILRPGQVYRQTTIYAFSTTRR